MKETGGQKMLKINNRLYWQDGEDPEFGHLFGTIVDETTLTKEQLCEAIATHEIYVVIRPGPDGPHGGFDMFDAAYVTEGDVSQMPVKPLLADDPADQRRRHCE
jgi:hypothetical protein